MNGAIGLAVICRSGAGWIHEFAGGHSKNGCLHGKNSRITAEKRGNQMRQKVLNSKLPILSLFTKKIWIFHPEKSSELTESLKVDGSRGRLESIRPFVPDSPRLTAIAHLVIQRSAGSKLFQRLHLWRKTTVLRYENPESSPGIFRNDTATNKSAGVRWMRTAACFSKPLFSYWCSWLRVISQ